MEFFGVLGGGNDPLGSKLARQVLSESPLGGWGAGNRVPARGLSQKKWTAPIILARTSSFASSSPIAEAFFSMHKLDICPVLYFLKRIFGYTTGKYVFGGKMMKISKTHFVTVNAAVLLIAASLLFGLTSCGNDSDSDSTPDPVADTTVYTAQEDDSSTCGAYAMAYFLTRTGQIAESDIEKTANRFYSEVQFTEEEASGDYEFLEGYSNPVLIASKLKTTWAESASLKMLATASTEAEELLAGLASGLGITDITSLSSFDQGFSDSDYCIEIIKSGSSSLHYLLTYKKSGVLFSRDPADGKEYKRSEIQTAHPKYQFCNGGVFLKSYAEGTIPSLITIKASEIEGLQDTLKAKQEAGFDFVTVKITDMTDAKEAMDWTTLDMNDENSMTTLSEYADERFSTLLEAICAVQGETTMEMNSKTGYCDFTFSGMAISLDLSETALTYLPFAAFCDLTGLSSGGLIMLKCR